MRPNVSDETAPDPGNGSEADNERCTLEVLLGQITDDNIHPEISRELSVGGEIW